MTDRYAVIGNPVAHSRSPEVHALLAQACGQDMTYGRILAPLDGFAAAMASFRDSGGRGLNVAAPFQFEALRCATHPSARARACGSVNVLRFEASRIEGENFDGVGLVRDLQLRGLDLRGRRVLLLGAGGTAHGVLPALLGLQPAEVVVAHTDEDEARALQQRALAAAGGPARVAASDYPGLVRERFDAVFNATSASFWNELPPVPATVFEGCTFAYELSYGQPPAFLRLAGNAGVPLLADGLGMLAEQSAETFAWWRGVRPSTDALRRHLLPA